MPASMKNGASQRKRCASWSPNGTPTAAATEKAVITIPIADARRFAGTTSPMIAITIEIESPPDAPLKARAASNVVALRENAHASVHAMKPT